MHHQLLLAVCSRCLPFLPTVPAQAPHSLICPRPHAPLGSTLGGRLLGWQWPQNDKRVGDRSAGTQGHTGRAGARAQVTKSKGNCRCRVQITNGVRDWIAKVEQNFWKPDSRSRDKQGQKAENPKVQDTERLTTANLEAKLLADLQAAAIGGIKWEGFHPQPPAGRP